MYMEMFPRSKTFPLQRRRRRVCGYFADLGIDNGGGVVLLYFFCYSSAVAYPERRARQGVFDPVSTGRVKIRTNPSRTRCRNGLEKNVSTYNNT